MQTYLCNYASMYVFDLAWKCYCSVNAARAAMRQGGKKKKIILMDSSRFIVDECLCLFEHAPHYA